MPAESDQSAGRQDEKTLRTNAADLITISVIGEIAAPRWGDAYRVGFDGRPRILPGPGGIVYDVQVGDRAFGWVGDHVEPGVSIKNPDQRANSGLNVFACIGNEAYVVSGAARGARGTVTGLHGGIEHVLIHFPQEVLEQLVVGDRIQVRARGQGLALLDWPQVLVMNTAPELLAALGLRTVNDGENNHLTVPVAAIIPAHLMGAGIGAPSAERGDYDLTTQDRTAIEELGLDELRLGDIVAVENQSAAFGRSYRRGAMEIGVIVHSDSYQAGHGPGVVSLLTSHGGELRPVLNPQANIARYLKLRADL